MNSNDFRYFLSPVERVGRGEAVIPLPNPGEGGPVYPGDSMPVEPVIPLPNPGEGGPVYPGETIPGEPVLPLPDVGEGGPVYPGNGIPVEPVIPLPNPGEGGPVYPGNSSEWPCPGGICGGTVIFPGNIGVPRPGISRMRLLNAAYDYPPFRISVGNNRFVNRLNYAAVTGYGRFRAGYQTVTVSSLNGYVYLQKSMPFPANGITTIAIINTAGGLDLLQITDSCFPPSHGWSSFRVGNLAYNSGPLDVLLGDGRVIYSDLRYKEVAAFKRIMPGTYQFFYADTNLAPMPAAMDIETLDPAWLGVYPPHEIFGSFYLNISSSEVYTIYLLQNGPGRNNIQNLILVDR